MMVSRDFVFVPVESCYVCDAQTQRPAFERRYVGHVFRWVRCTGCGLIYQNPKLSRESLHRVYSSPQYWEAGDARPPGGRLGYADYVRGDVYRLRQARSRMAIVARFVVPGSRILDVACATGFFVKVARDCGMDARGIDLSAAMARFGRETYDIEIEVADFDLMEVPAKSFDSITIWGSDSNFCNPRDTFEKVRSVLRDGGFLFFNFWDFDHPARALLGDFKMNYNALYYFNRSNLSLLLERTGFGLRHVGMEWQYAALEAILTMTNRWRLATLVRRLGCQDVIVRIPTLSGFVVAAQKV